jgi:pimeloyl-ACP methyl ester carboxylesterase
MIPEPRTVTVGSGRTVGLYEYGNPTGQPVMVFHGVPACGAGFVFADEPARERRLRLIAPDRPGVGLSTAFDGWTVGSYPSMVTEFADALDIDRFAVWGYSGGGPYAVACAAAVGERVSRAAISAGMGQVGVWAEDDDFEKSDRQMLAMARTRPGLARTIMAVTSRLARMSPKSATKSFAKQLSESDRAVIDTLGTPAEAMALYTQAFLRGARGVIDDYRAIGQPWGVDLAAITAPVKVFQGDADPMVPVRHSQELAQRVRGAELVIWPGEGHLATVTHVREILDFLATA